MTYYYYYYYYYYYKFTKLVLIPFKVNLLVDNNLIVIVGVIWNLFEMIFSWFSNYILLPANRRAEETKWTLSGRSLICKRKWSGSSKELEFHVELYTS